MDIVEELKNYADAVDNNWAEARFYMDKVILEITRLREQLAASQAECIALQNRMDEQVTAWRAECLDLQNKLAEATEKAG